MSRRVSSTEPSGAVGAVCVVCRARRTDLKGTMSITDFAKAIGMSLNGVKKAIRSGRIPQSCVKQRQSGSRRPYVITDAAKAATCWAETTSSIGAGTMSGGAEVDYSKLPDDVRRARMLRELMVAKLAEAKLRAYNVAVPQRDAVRRSTVTVALRAAMQAAIRGADIQYRAAVRAAVRKMERAIMKEIT